MAAPKILQILITLNKDEWYSFKKTVSSHFSENSDTYRVFAWLYDKKKDLASLNDVSAVVAKYFNGMTSKVFLNHLSILYQILEKWMVMDQLMKENATFKLILHRNLQKRGLYSFADQLSTQLQKEISDRNDIVAKSTQKEILHQEYYSFNPIKYQKRARGLSELVIATNEYISYILSIYKTELVNWGKIQNHDFTEYEEKLEGMIKLCHPMGNNFFHRLFELFKHQNIEILDELKTRLFNNEWQKGSLEEVISTIYLIRKGAEMYEKSRNETLSKTITELMEFSMKQEVYTEHGKITPLTFRNIVGQLSKYQKFDYVQEFILRWYHQVTSEYLESTRDVCLAMNCFKNEKYEEIFLLTRMKHFHDDTEKALALSLHLIACFEQRDKDYDLYVTSLYNYTSYLKRNKSAFSPKFYIGMLNTIDILKKYDQGKEISLSAYDQIFYKDWCEKMMRKKG